MGPETLIDAIGRALGDREPRRAEAGSFEHQAAVSLVLRPGAADLEFLAIQRSESERDPWSGHMALPGGRRDPGDGSLWYTAVRETREEVGIDLEERGRRLGQLDDVRPASRQIPAIAITPFVAAVDRDLDTRSNYEVERTVWVPLEALVDGGYRGRLVVEGAEQREFPTIEYEGYVIWGLTLSVLSQMRSLLEALGYRGGRIG